MAIRRQFKLARGFGNYKGVDGSRDQRTIVGTAGWPRLNRRKYDMPKFGGKLTYGGFAKKMPSLCAGPHQRSLLTESPCNKQNCPERDE
jgi:hypothetical protein